jgi:hypothetical protein
MNDDLLTSDQAAEVIGVCGRYVRQITTEGTLPSVPVTARQYTMRLVRRADAEAFAARRRARMAQKTAATAA